MVINYRVYTKAAAHSPWRDTGIVESGDKVFVEWIWSGIIKDLRYHSFKLFAITYGIPIQR